MVYKKRVILCLPDEIYEEIEKKTKQFGVTRNELIRFYLIYGLFEGGVNDGKNKGVD